MYTLILTPTFWRNVCFFYLNIFFLNWTPGNKKYFFLPLFIVLILSLKTIKPLLLWKDRKICRQLIRCFHFLVVTHTLGQVPSPLFRAQCWLIWWDELRLSVTLLKPRVSDGQTPFSLHLPLNYRRVPPPVRHDGPTSFSLSARKFQPLTPK